MTRLIDADAMKKSIEELKRSPWFNSTLNPSWHAGIKEALEVVELVCIDKEPTIDAVPVIRCKDCKHRDPEDKKCDCGHSIIWQLPRSDEWFCADAERKGEE